ncbi:MAG TPA: hypothetical protein EYG85_01670, partial [Crocinitomix sp.]|nr:hypothetical protein [Crocinitomix sp.]
MKNYSLLLTTTLFLLLTTIAFAQPANDACSSPTIITSTITSYENYSFNFTNANTEIESSVNYNDVWYEFEMPYDGNIYIFSYSIYNTFELFNNCGDFIVNGSNNVTTNNSVINFTQKGNIYALTANTTYRLRVFRAAAYANSIQKQFWIQSFEKATNDT